MAAGGDLKPTAVRVRDDQASRVAQLLAARLAELGYDVSPEGFEVDIPDFQRVQGGDHEFRVEGLALQINNAVVLSRHAAVSDEDFVGLAIYVWGTHRGHRNPWGDRMVVTPEMIRWWKATDRIGGAS